MKLHQHVPSRYSIVSEYSITIIFVIEPQFWPYIACLDPWI